MPLYWLCYRHNNQISVVIEPAPSPLLLELLEHSDENLRWWAVQLLCEDKNVPAQVLQRFAAMARRRYPARSLVLAGGLTPENVGRAVAEVAPFAVDVASGVESAPGVKDPVKLAAFVAAVRG